MPSDSIDTRPAGKGMRAAGLSPARHRISSHWILDLALRNTRRNKRRTVLAVSSIALSVMLITFLGGFAGGVLDNMVRNITKNTSGHVRIITKGFAERESFMPLDELVADPGAVKGAIMADERLSKEVTEVAERITFGTLLSNGPATKAAMGFAGEPAIEKDLIGLDRSLVAGRSIAGPGETILGETLADDLGLAIGERIKVVTQGADYGLRLKTFEIVGLFKTGQYALDSALFQIPIEDAKSFLRTGGAVQQILVMLKNYERANAARDLIDAALARSGLNPNDEILVQSWKDVGDYPGMIEYMEQIYFFIYLIVAFLGAFIITNILTMVVLERRREIGILKSMGLRRREILGLFLAEGGIMGVIGSAIGSLLGTGLCISFSIFGIDFSDAMGTLTMPVDPVFYSRVDPLQIITLFILGVAVSLIVSIGPSRRAARMNAVDAIKSVA